MEDEISGIPMTREREWPEGLKPAQYEKSIFRANLAQATAILTECHQGEVYVKKGRYKCNFWPIITAWIVLIYKVNIVIWNCV